MTRQRILEDTISAAVGYLAGLGILLLWPDRQGFSPLAILAVGSVSSILAGISTDWLLFRRPPRIEFGRRPSRYSILQFVGLLAAGLGVLTLLNSQEPDRGLIAYAGFIPLVLTSVIASNLWWAHAGTPTE